MTEHTLGADNITIQLPEGNEEFQVQGFAEAYEKFLDENPPLTVVDKLPELTLALLGGVIAAIGVLTLMFGPDSVMVNLITGPTFYQYVLLYPGYVFSLGALLFSVGMNLLAKTRGVTPELFLTEKYTLIGNGADLSDGSLEYLGESRFILRRKVGPDDDRSA